MARAIEAPTREVLEELAKHLNDKIPELREILLDFPESNRVLKYPSLSIATRPLDFVNWQPYVYEQGVVASNKAKVKYVVGQYNWKFQLDLWERSKEERHDLYERVFAAFLPNIPKTGLHLRLKNYHNVVCSYEITNYSVEDTEVASQRKEWRGTLDIEANSKAVLTKEEYIIVTTDLTLETPDTIPVPE